MRRPRGRRHVVSSAMQPCSITLDRSIRCTAAARDFMRWSISLPRSGMVAVKDAEHGWNEEQCGDGCDRETADHRTTERRMLLAAFAHGERDRNHADDHGKRCHEHGTETGEAGLQGRGGGIEAVLQAFTGKAD